MPRSVYGDGFRGSAHTPEQRRYALSDATTQAPPPAAPSAGPTHPHDVYRRGGALSPRVQRQIEASRETVARSQQLLNIYSESARGVVRPIEVGVLKKRVVSRTHFVTVLSSHATVIPFTAGACGV